MVGHWREGWLGFVAHAESFLPLCQTLVHDLLHIRIRLTEDVAAEHIADKFFEFGEAGPGEFVRELFRRDFECEPGAGFRPAEEILGLGCGRPRKFEPELKASPHGPVEEFGVVGGSDDHDVRGKLVDLEQE